MNGPLVSIIIPHYQTPDLVRLCLRSIRRHTQHIPYEVIVVDNGSPDGPSLDHLRQVEWIHLIERRDDIGPLGIGHKEAVDIGVESSRGAYVLAFHTDTIPIRHDWLSWHVKQINAGERIGAVGTYKLELKSPMQAFLKYWEPILRLGGRRRRATGDHRPYIRSHCALYRRDLLRRFNLRYNADHGETAGRNVHLGLEQHGYEARLLDVEETLRRVVHLNHGTMVLRPELGAKRRTIARGLKRMEAFLARPEIQSVLNDDSLDRGSRDELLRAA